MEILHLEHFKNYSDIYIGDIHGEMYPLVSNLTKFMNISNANIFILGDIGMGFNKENYYLNELSKVNKKLADANINLILFRGNHDDPSYFKNGKYNQPNIFFVDDYTIVNTELHQCLCIGGARSIDKFTRFKWDKRTQKRVPFGYWEDEVVRSIPEEFDSFIEANNTQIDVVLTHCAPMGIEDRSIPEVVLENDPDFANDVEKEKEILYNVFTKVKPKYWFYGHYHYSNVQYLNDCKFTACKDYVCGYKPELNQINDYSEKDFF